MKTKVVISAQAEVDIENAYLYIRQDAPETAARWRRRLLSAICTLDHFPLRYEIAPEARDAGIELRHMLFGAYRVLYLVDGKTVRIQGVRHGARRPMRLDELPDAD